MPWAILFFYCKHQALQVRLYAIVPKWWLPMMHSSNGFRETQLQWTDSVNARIKIKEASPFSSWSTFWSTLRWTRFGSRRNAPSYLNCADPLFATASLPNHSSAGLFFLSGGGGSLAASAIITDGGEDIKDEATLWSRWPGPFGHLLLHPSPPYNPPPLLTGLSSSTPGGLRSHRRRPSGPPK